MTVKIANKPLNGPFGLSETGRRVLGLIDGGLQWLDYAIGTPDAHYHFRDESALVAAVQTGLHATRYVLIDAIGLMVAPVKLMTMSPAELQLLARAATGEVKPTNPDLVKMLGRHSLTTQKDLAAVATLLDNLEVAPAPMFQAMDLDDTLALLVLARSPCITDPGTPDLRLEAASFAVSQAYSPPEFVDYFRTFIDHIAIVGEPGDTPTDRRERVLRAVYTLAPLMFQALDCPEVAGLVSPLEVEGAIIDWLMNGRQLGFLRVSQGVQQIVANTGFANEEGLAAQLIVRDYLDRAQQLVRLLGVGRGIMGQDGATCLFPIVAPAQDAVIRLGPTGVITLAQFAWQHPLRQKDTADGRPSSSPRPAKPPASPGAPTPASRVASRTMTRPKVIRRRKGSAKK
jgi:hypothetical protein